jgi:glycine C-acetyltransferase
MEKLNNMIIDKDPGVGENMDLREILLSGGKKSLKERTDWFEAYIRETYQNQDNYYSRIVISAAGREVKIIDPLTGKVRKMLMFGSNNYLGLANHPYVNQKVRDAISKYGVGIGGPPLLNGYTILMKELEDRLSSFKKEEDTLIFSSGFSANLGLSCGLFCKSDLVLYDELSHASLYDGLKMVRTCKASFGHNNLPELELKLEQNKKLNCREAFVCVEGVYSMDGDLAPLDELFSLCRRYDAHLVIDDAHGTGIMGKEGRGTAEHFGLPPGDKVLMGTFSKTFAMTGGFISAAKPIINYLRYFARTYMFSASLPPVAIAAILAGLDVIEKEPERRIRLHKNIHYAISKLKPFNLIGPPSAAILSLKVPFTMNIRKAAALFHKQGIFINSIEYPAVPVTSQRFRISLMADHTWDDIDRLVACVEEIWQKYKEV